MVELSTLIEGAILLARFEIFLAIAGGMVFGLLIGVIPGMTAALGLAILLPLTFVMDSITALVLLTSVYTGSLTGGGILAILINTPGTPGALATTFDGYPMARQGRHNEALGLQIMASVVGGLLSYIALLIIIQPLAKLALEFGPSETLALTIFVLVIIAVIVGDAFLKALFAGFLGLMASTIGASVSTGTPRGTFGLIELEDGLPLILVVIGMFAIPELIALTTRKSIAEGDVSQDQDFSQMMRGVGRALKSRMTLLRSSAIGISIGVLPAAGATLASLLSYSVAKRGATPEQKFGDGEPEGVVAAECANNASEGGAMATLLALGIPGSASTAVILGGFLLHGLVPGAGLFRDNGPLVYGLILANIVQMAVLGFFAIGIAFSVARVVRVPTQVLLPALLVLIALGAFSFRNLMVDVVILFGAGIVGYLLRRYNFAPVGFMIGLFLGRPLDEEMVRFTVLFGDDLTRLLDRPITLTLIALTLMSLGFQLSGILRQS